jgi:ABC-type lipoprotein export system ATPase subunit/ABC-type transporter Mla maintaining outer membrane lipid asymmetry permease subunit MlaE
LNPAADRPLALAIEDLRVVLPDGRALLDGANLAVREGDFVLLAGPSGSGKSTILRLIANLPDSMARGVEVTGRVHKPASADGSPATVGIVFQDLALFDELSAELNVRFAMDHRVARAGHAAPRADSPDREATQRLTALGVPLGRRLTSLSGGERQRVAVARALATDPAILLFDEPTTGLDPRRARSVADLIAETHRTSGRTTIVVTHDFEPFLRHGPRLVLVEAGAGGGALAEVSVDQLRGAFSGEEPAAASVAARTDGAGRPAADSRVMTLLELSGDTTMTLAGSVVAPLKGWRHPAWRLRYLWHYLRLTLVGSTAIYVAVAGAMLGFVTVLFGLSQMPQREITLPLLREEFLAATGFSTYRVLTPLLIAVLMAGKCGAAVAADIGARRLTRQQDAMRSLGGDPAHYLQGNIILALLVAAPVLTLIAFLTTAASSMVAFLIAEPEATGAVFRRNFLATIWPSWSPLPWGSEWLLIKQVVTGFLIGGLAYAIGGRAKSSAVDVSRDVGLTIFWSSLAVLAWHAAFSFVEF